MHTFCTWSEDVYVVYSGYPVIIFFQLFAFFNLVFFSCDTMAWVTCGRNSSYSFIPNFLKLKMCICFWGYSPIISHQLFSTFFNVFHVPISIGIDTLWVQLTLQFSTHLIKLGILVLRGLKICVWFWGYPLNIFINFLYFFGFVFSRSN